MEQVKSLTPNQLGALNSENTDKFIFISTLTSPIVLDLAGTGVKTVGSNMGVHFDLSGNGSHQQVGWIGSGSGFLVRDINHDGIINNGTELFGTATTLASGAKAPDGFAALSQLDTNHDGVIDAKDAAFNELGVWVDANHDGITQAGEIHSLSPLHIAKLNLNTNHTAVNNNGNWVILDSTYTTTDGQTHEMADVWFQNQTVDVSSMTTVEIASLTADQIHSLTTSEVASLNIDQIHALTTAQITTLDNDQIHALTTAQIISLDDVQVHALTTGQISALTPEQVHAMTTTEIAALSPDQIAAMTTADVSALTNSQIAVLTPDDVAALHNLGKDSAFTDMQIKTMDADQLKALTHHQGLDSVIAMPGEHTTNDATYAGMDAHSTTAHDLHAVATVVPDDQHQQTATQDQQQVIPGIMPHEKIDMLLG